MAIARPVDERARARARATAPLARIAARLRVGPHELEELLWHAGAMAGAPNALSAVSPFADLLASRSLDHGWPAPAVRKLVRLVASRLGLPPAVVSAHMHQRTARDPFLLQLPPRAAMETQFRVLRALASLEELSLWMREPADRLTCVLSLGRPEPTRRARLVARQVLDQGRWRPTDPELIQGVPVLVWELARAALVFRAPRQDRAAAVAAVRETAAALGPILERDSLLVRNAARERALMETGERLLMRIGFDLHDGPIQEIVSLAGDLRVLESKLCEGASDTARRGVQSSIGSLQERLASADRSLRDIVHSMESPTVLEGPVEELVRREVNLVAAQTEISVTLDVRGAFDRLTASQRIALIRIVQEALANAREHSRARRVSVVLKAGAASLSAEITDDGCGFNVERTLVHAARRGRFGLVGMSERVRLLGGRLDIASRPGGPTTVNAVLPAWQPVSSEHVAAEPVSAG